ncbi:hypothetical protein HPB49_013971 [Dermacentor silvarum]|uniref:Uncharacterized protein n=1 Tax=Dermacentor silvarum TaxID=543639 RepID=A0ACB8D614_DERSI|nr:hypothetical protein HPB49_013971 [Dermacentor silvarum]
MKTSAIFLVVVAALHGVDSAFVGSLLLPFGGITSTIGVIRFKISVAAAVLSMLGQGFNGDADVRTGANVVGSLSREESERRGLLDLVMTTTTTTEQPQVRVSPIPALQDILNVDQKPKPQTDLLFTFLKDLDDQGCVSRMVCESAADAQRLGKVGKATVHFFNNNVVLKTGPASVFVAAAEIGRSRGLAGCAQAFPDCTANLPDIISVSGLM